MLNSLAEEVKAAGNFGLLNVLVGVVGSVGALVTLVMTFAQPKIAKALATMCLLGVLVALGLGLLGYEIGLVGMRHAIPNVPAESHDLILRKGTQDARANFLVAALAALLPLLAGVLGAVRTRFVAALVLCPIAVIAFGASVVQLARELPPALLIVLPEGVKWPRSESPSEVRLPTLIALTPEGLWANAKRVGSLDEALAEPLVSERFHTATGLTLFVDARVQFAQLADVLEAAARADKHSFQLVVQSPNGDPRYLSVLGPRGEQFVSVTSPVHLTMRLSAKTVTIGALKGTLPTIPFESKALSDKLTSVRTALPNEKSIRVTAEPSVTVEQVVSALDVATLRDGKILFDYAVVGRFELPAGEPEPE